MNFERIRMVRIVRMVRSLADRTFQLWSGARIPGAGHPRPVTAADFGSGRLQDDWDQGRVQDVTGGWAGI